MCGVSLRKSHTTLPGMMSFWVIAISAAPDSQESGRFDILMHPYTTACAAGVVTGTATSVGDTARELWVAIYHGNRRTRQLTVAGLRLQLC